MPAPTTPTRRGVLWLGLHCNVQCEFCYDERLPRSRKEWVDVDAIKTALTKFRRFYANEHVDFMGGEPTLHPHIVEVIEHCAAIGLRPTLITHGMKLADRDFARRLVDAGLDDVLMSVHGVGDTVRAIHGVGRNNAERQLAALENLNELGVPIRFNVTVVSKNVAELPAIAQLAIKKSARVVNFLTFNPYFEWRSDPEIPFQIKHSQAAPLLKQAIDLLTEAGIEANVRYFPICVLSGYERHIFTGHQLPFDEHEWDYNSWYDRGLEGPATIDFYRQAAAEQAQRHDYHHARPCTRCAAQAICDGLHEQYLQRFGDDELVPFDGPPITDPRHFISQQPVVVHEPQPQPLAEAASDGLPLALTQFDSTLGHRAGVKRQPT